MIIEGSIVRMIFNPSEDYRLNFSYKMRLDTGDGEAIPLSKLMTFLV